MDLFDVVRACVRRWYVFLPLLLVTLGLSYHFYSAVKPVYYSNAVVGLAPPNSKLWQAPNGEPVPLNGLLEAGGPTLLANMAVLGMKDPSVAARVVAAGGGPNYTAKMFPTSNNAPQLALIMVESTESDPQVSAKTVSAAVGQVDPVLKSLQQQAGVPPNLMVNALAASPPSPPIAATPSRTKSAVTTMIGGLIVTVIAVVAADVVLSRRGSSVGGANSVVAGS